MLSSFQRTQQRDKNPIMDDKLCAFLDRLDRQVQESFCRDKQGNEQQSKQRYMSQIRQQQLRLLFQV